MTNTETLEKLRTFKGLILDADGVWFDGYEERGVLPSGEVIVIKRRHFHDAQGLSFLRALDIKVVFSTGEGEPMQSIVGKLNELPSAVSGRWAPVDYFVGDLKKGGKVNLLESWQIKNKLTWDDCAYIGDDRTDLEAMIKANLKVVPIDATRVIQKIADIILSKKGGKGAIREFAEMVLDARGIDESTLPTA